MVKLLPEIGIAAFFSVLAGCSSLSRGVVEPDTITLQAAMFDLGKSFSEFEKGRGPVPLGLLPCEIDITFNVGAKGSDTTDVGVSGAGQLVVTEPLRQRTSSVSPRLGYQGYSEGARSNQVAIKLRHIQCLQNTVAANNPNIVTQIVRDQNEGGVSGVLRDPGNI